MIIFSNSGNTEEALELVEIVEQDIIDHNIQVGSNFLWTGSGSEPQWDNPKSTKAYDNIWSYHGPKRPPLRFQGRAAGTNDSQGQWLNAEDWVKAEKLTPKHPGRYILKFNRPIGRVYHPDGTITENVICALIQRNTDGTLNCGYPVVDTYTLRLLNRSPSSE